MEAVVAAAVAAATAVAAAAAAASAATAVEAAAAAASAATAVVVAVAAAVAAVGVEELAAAALATSPSRTQNGNHCPLHRGRTGKRKEKEDYTKNEGGGGGGGEKKRDHGADHGETPQRRLCRCCYCGDGGEPERLSSARGLAVCCVGVCGWGSSEADLLE